MSELITYVLAVWRLAHMVVKEPGPGNIMANFRYHLVQQGWIPEWVVNASLCVSCLSMWVAGFLLIIDRTPFRWIRWVLAGSAVAKLLEDYFYESAGEVVEDLPSDVPPSTTSPFVPSEYWMAGRD